MSNGIYGKSLKAWFANSIINIELQLNPFYEFKGKWHWIPTGFYQYNKDNRDLNKVHIYFTWVFFSFEARIGDGSWR